MNLNKVKVVLSTIIILSTHSIHAFSLKQAEQIALKNAPELKVLSNKQKAHSYLSVSKSQWMDPILELGAMNLPTDTFRFNQENMTQLKIGIKQMIPKGDSLKFKHAIESIKARATFSQRKLKRLEILKSLRNAWVERFYWRQTRWILLKQRSTFNHLVEVTESLYANNKAQQKDVLNAKMQVSKVQEQIVNAQRAYQATTANLARWLGYKRAKSIHPQSMPWLGKLPSIGKQNKKLGNHPLISKASDEIAMKRAKSNLIKEDFKPGFSVGVGYGHRQDMPNGRRRADFLSIGLNVSLPVHTKSKQSQNYQAALSEVSASMYQKQSVLNQLRELLNDTYVKWLSFRDKVHIYRASVLPDARGYAKASLISYQNAKLDFPTPASGYVELYRLEIKKEQLRLMQAKQKINLLYLNGR